VTGRALFQRLWRVAVNATVTQDCVLKVTFQGIKSLFKEQNDVLFLMREVLQALIVL
jgi:hypothetical protein